MIKISYNLFVFLKEEKFFVGSSFPPYSIYSIYTCTEVKLVCFGRCKFSTTKKLAVYLSNNQAWILFRKDEIQIWSIMKVSVYHVFVTLFTELDRSCLSRKFQICKTEKLDFNKILGYFYTKQIQRFTDISI